MAGFSEEGDDGSRNKSTCRLETVTRLVCDAQHITAPTTTVSTAAATTPTMLTPPLVKRRIRSSSFKTLADLKQAVKNYLLWPSNKATYGAIGSWDVSGVTDMSSLFKETCGEGNHPEFNENINSWDVRNVKNMKEMFSGCKYFNSDLDWKTSTVTSMESMFSGAESFNGDVSSWDVEEVEKMTSMFSKAESFNGDLTKWSFKSGADISAMFVGADAWANNYALSGASITGLESKWLSDGTIIHSLQPEIVSDWITTSNATQSTLVGGIDVNYAWPGVWSEYTLGSRGSINFAQGGVRGAWKQWSWDNIITFYSSSRANPDTTMTYTIQVSGPYVGCVDKNGAVCRVGTVLLTPEPAQLDIVLDFERVGKYKAKILGADAQGSGSTVVLREWDFTVCPGEPNWGDPVYAPTVSAAYANMDVTKAYEAGCPAVSSTTTTTTTMTNIAASSTNKAALTGGIAGGVIVFVLLVVVIAVLAVRYYTDELRVAARSRNDPLSKIGLYITNNREHLASSIRITANFRARFDTLFEETIVKDYNKKSNAWLLPALREIHANIKASAAARVGVGNPLIQPDLGFVGLDVGGNGDERRKKVQMGYLAELIEVVRHEEPTSDALMEDIVLDLRMAGVGVHDTIKFSAGPIKGMDRVLEKADLKGHHFERLYDYGRAAIIVEHVAQVPAVLKRIEEGTEFDIVRCKNRFDPEYDSVKSGGYRDYQLVLRNIEGTLPASDSRRSLAGGPSKRRLSLSSKPLKVISSPWLFELQIMTREFHDLKMGRGIAGDADDAHAAYKDFRKFAELRDRMNHQVMVMDKQLLLLDVLNKEAVQKRRSSEMLLKNASTQGKQQWYSGLTNALSFINRSKKTPTRVVPVEAHGVDDGVDDVPAADVPASIKPQLVVRNANLTEPKLVVRNTNLTEAEIEAKRSSLSQKSVRSIASE